MIDEVVLNVRLRGTFARVASMVMNHNRQRMGDFTTGHRAGDLEIISVDSILSVVESSTLGILRHEAATPAGVGSFVARIRGCRFAQPPATGWHPFGMAGRRTCIRQTRFHRPGAPVFPAGSEFRY